MLNFQRPTFQRGVSLIELMIAMVAGLIVTGAAVALIVAMMKSNAETIKATRLTQELRATAEVIGRDLRRSRSVSDPIGNVDVSSTILTNECNAVTVNAAKTCVQFAYDCSKDTSTTPPTITGSFKAIGLAGSKVKLTTASAAAPACPTTTTGTQLSSDAININSFTITAATGDAYTISLAGQFANDPSTTPLVRTFSQEVRIRSAAVN
jgi:type IV pilus assembly protein PilW